MRQAIADFIETLYPGSTVESAHRFDTDDDDLADSTEKGIGYGAPIHIQFRDAGGARRSVVLHTATADEFGHDRRADRAAEMILGYDTFGALPGHVAPLDVGFVKADGTLASIRDGTECYLLTDYVDGQIYAHDLRELSQGRALQDDDLKRCDALVDCLVTLHSERYAEPPLYRRAIRDVVGHGEGIFGLIDGYPDDVPMAGPKRLQAIETAAVQWRWVLRDRHTRLCRTHGDFHPFNLIFNERSELTLLDAARGCRGDAADDVCCLALNYVFFAVGHDGAWHGKLGTLWERFWKRYLERSGDEQLLDVAPPFVAWRALVMAHPQWYPNVTAQSRNTLLEIVERALDAGCFDPDSVKALFT